MTSLYCPFNTFMNIKYCPPYQLIHPCDRRYNCPFLQEFDCIIWVNGLCWGKVSKDQLSLRKNSAWATALALFFQGDNGLFSIFLLNKFSLYRLLRFYSKIKVWVIEQFEWIINVNINPLVAKWVMKLWSRGSPETTYGQICEWESGNLQPWLYDAR